MHLSAGGGDSLHLPTPLLICRNNVEHFSKSSELRLVCNVVQTNNLQVLVHFSPMGRERELVKCNFQDKYRGSELQGFVSPNASNN